MHELSIAEALLALCRERLQPGQQLRCVRVAVGELAALDPELLRFAWTAVLAGTRDDGARLDVDFVRARQTCGNCGEVAERQPGTWLRLCPGCGAPLQIAGGDELDLLAVEPADPLAFPSAPNAREPAP